MQISNEDKQRFLKAFTSLLKEANGRGPKNIYIKYFSEEMHIVVQGIITEFEKYLIKRFGNEAISIFDDFYERDCKNIESFLVTALDDKYMIKWYQLDADFDEDIFIYKFMLNLA